MKRLNFNLNLVNNYKSYPQRIRILSEDWLSREGYCPACGRSLTKAQNNSPVFDFYCPFCLENYELKSKNKDIGSRIVNGAYKAMIERLSSDTNPSLFILNYDSQNWDVINFFVIPKHFFVEELIECRKPLKATARRAGWIGCNLLMDRIPEAGRIFLIQHKAVIPPDQVLKAWKETLFLREEENKELRGWILIIMKCIDTLKKPEFKLDEMYAFEESLKQEYPNNRHIKDKIRQQLQYLRDLGYLEFLGRGKYRKIVLAHS